MYRCRSDIVARAIVRVNRRLPCRLGAGEPLVRGPDASWYISDMDDLRSMP